MKKRLGWPENRLCPVIFAYCVVFWVRCELWLVLENRMCCILCSVMQMPLSTGSGSKRHAPQIEINMTQPMELPSWPAQLLLMWMSWERGWNWHLFGATHMTRWHQEQRQQGQEARRACPVENMKNVKQKSGKNFSNLKLPTKKYENKNKKKVRQENAAGKGKARRMKRDKDGSKQILITFIYPVRRVT